MAATAEREAQQRQQWAENAQRIAEMWAQCVPLVPGDPVTLYLKRRGFGGVWPLPEVLRLHRALPYWHGAEKLGTFPAMVAPIVAPDGRTVALHRTYLTADGRKADVPSVKKLTGAAGPLAGACIPLHKPAQRLHRHRRRHRNGAGRLVCIGRADGGRVQRRQPGRLAVAGRRAAAGDLRRPDHAGREAAETLQARALRAGLQSR